MSDYRIAFDESFRFEGLLAALRLSSYNDDDDVANIIEVDGIWEARTAVMAFINTLINCPESLEERMHLREEFARRGLNEIVVVRMSLDLLYSASDQHTDYSLYSCARILAQAS